MATPTVKGKIASAIKATKDTVGPVVQATKDVVEKLKTMDYQLVNIIGESVSFVPTGLAPSETTIVEFDKYYRPDGISDEEFASLEKTMRRLFDGTRKAVADPDTGEDSDTFVSEPLPPCSEKEKFLVLESLLHRKRILFQQLYNQGILTPDEMKKKIATLKDTQSSTSLEGKDSLLVRTLLTHLLRLEKFIEFYVQSQHCINVEDLVYGKLELDLDDDRIKELLKQFIFFLLQSSHPLKDYTKIKPTPPTFVARLEKNLLKDKFPTFLQSYKDNKFPIPDTIAKVLVVTNLDPKVMKDQVEQAIQLERKRIVKHLQNTIPPTDKFWKQVGPTEDVIRILDVLQDNEGAMKDEIALLSKEKQDLDTKLKACLQSENALKAEKVRFEQRIQALEATIQTHTDASNQLAILRNEQAKIKAKDTSIAELQRQLAEKENQVTSIRTEISTKNEEKRGLEKQIGDSTTRIQELEDELQSLTDQITEAQGELGPLNQQLATAKERILTLEKEVSAEKTKANDFALQRDACTKELEALKSTASTSQKTVGDLTRNLEVAKGERDTALAQKNLLEAETKTLRAQLGDALEENKLHKQDILTKENTIKELTSTVESKEQEISTLAKQASDEKKRANIAEAKVEEVEREKDAMSVLAQRQIASVSEELKSNYETAMGKAQEVYDSALATQEAEKEKVLEIVRNIRDWIDSGSTTAFVIPAETPEVDSFSSIVESLSKPEDSTSTSSSSPKAGKEQQTIIICYLVFLTSFLWQMHFPSFQVIPTTEPAREQYQRQQSILTLFQSFFNGGADPRAKTTASAPISGLYKDIDPVRETSTIFKLLDTFYNLMRSMEDDPKKYLGYISFAEKDILDKLMKKIDLFVSANNMKSTFVRNVSDFFITRQPQVNPGLLDKFITYDVATKTIRVVEKTTEANPSYLNYAVLFYCYLVCIRDYLNHIKGSTVKCQLPQYLLKK